MTNLRNPTPRLRSKHMGPPTWNQVRKIAAKFGNKNRMAKALGISRITVYFWDYALPYGDGLIPREMIPKIQAIARREGILFRDSDWVPERIQVQEEEEPISLMGLYDQTK